MLSDFQPWIDRWRLTPDGEAFVTPFGSRLLPVRHNGVPAMLKVALHEEERRGGAVMAWYAGDGAASVFAYDAEAVLLERLKGPRSLDTMARSGEDGEACRILCEAALRLHAPRAEPPPQGVVPLHVWFAALWSQADRSGGLYAKAAAVARRLLADQGPAVVLHGDIHHGNVLDGGSRGWLAIDPKGLFGDRGYDFANLICNPDAETALANLDDRLVTTAELSGQPRERVLAWLLAYTGLSASWTLSGGGDPWQAVAIGEAAAARLDL